MPSSPAIRGPCFTSEGYTLGYPRHAQARSDSSFLGREPKSKASLGKASQRPSSLAPETLPDRGSEQS